MDKKFTIAVVLITYATIVALLSQIEGLTIISSAILVAVSATILNIKMIRVAKIKKKNIELFKYSDGKNIERNDVVKIKFGMLDIEGRVSSIDYEKKAIRLDISKDFKSRTLSILFEDIEEIVDRGFKV